MAFQNGARTEFVGQTPHQRVGVICSIRYYSEVMDHQLILVYAIKRDIILDYSKLKHNMFVLKRTIFYNIQSDIFRPRPEGLGDYQILKPRPPRSTVCYAREQDKEERE